MKKAIRTKKSARAGAPEPRTSTEAVRRATGRNRETWFKLLDAWGAAKREHRDIAAWLSEEHGVDSWWAQTLTVDYEQAHGLRAPGGSRDGTFSIGATRTIDAPVERLYRAFVDARLRNRWLPDAMLRQRTAQPERSIRYDWEDGSTRLVVGFVAKGKGKSQVAVQHEKLKNAKAAEKAKTYWRQRMTALKNLLEG